MQHAANPVRMGQAKKGDIVPQPFAKRALERRVQTLLRMATHFRSLIERVRVRALFSHAIDGYARIDTLTSVLGVKP